MNIAIFFSGVTMATFGASALFFLKFWRVSRDYFFLCFGIACGLIALERLLALAMHSTYQTLFTADVEAHSWIYVIRLLAFASILMGVVGKNRSTPRR